MLKIEYNEIIEDSRWRSEELGYLPLALDQAAAYMSETQMPYQEYIDLFKKQRLKIFGEVKYESPFYKKTVATTWNLALDRIDNESAKQLIQLFAFLASDHISKDMFLQSSEHLPEPLASAVRDELKFNNIIQNLIRYSLIQIDKDHLSIHRLLQEVIRESLGDNKIQCFHYCVRILYKLFRYDQYDMKTWENCASLLPHLQSVLSHEKDLETETKEIAYLYAEGARWLQHTAVYDKVLEWLEKALAIREKVLGYEHPDTATTYNNIAVIYNNLGEYNQALDWHEKALTIYEKILGFEHPDTAATYNNIAFVYNNLGEYDKALEWYEKALAIYEKVLGYEHPSTATTYNNIAGVYYKLGEYDKVLECIERINIDKG